ncbi:hypothetical protein [Herpetosiphon gulosus]|uniref:Uncharacterized protein n=1 Tax=Herpetosiphon gulosus TaxID=1973496 RepID=A0ABP9X9Y7_9CHLR
MSTLSSTCPECGATFTPNLIETQPVGSANPDHTFVEGAEKFACPECGEWLEAQVRREIATGLASQIAPIAAIATIEAWDCRGCRFSPSGQQLAAQFGRQIQIFQRQGQQWRLTLTSPKREIYTLIGWLGEEMLVADDAIWDLTNDLIFWQDTQPMIFVKDTAFDPRQLLVLRGVAVEHRPHYKQILEAYQLSTNEEIRLEIGDLRNLNDHVVCWNVERGVSFCARPQVSRAAAKHDSNVIELWHYDSVTTSFQRSVATTLERGLIQQAWWQADGSLLAVAWYRDVGLVPYQSHAYGLVQLDGTTLEVLREQRWVGPQSVNSQLYFRQAAALPTGKILWHSNRISLLDADTWDVHETLNYQPTPRETVAFSPDGSSYAIGRPNDLIIVDRASHRAWSLRREREVHLNSRG